MGCWSASRPHLPTPSADDGTRNVASSGRRRPGLPLAWNTPARQRAAISPPSIQATVAAWILTTTSSSFGTGRLTSSSRRTSGGPVPVVDNRSHGSLPLFGLLETMDRAAVITRRPAPPRPRATRPYPPLDQPRMKRTLRQNDGALGQRQASSPGVGVPTKACHSAGVRSRAIRGERHPRLARERAAVGGDGGEHYTAVEVGQHGPHRRWHGAVGTWTGAAGRRPRAPERLSERGPLSPRTRRRRGSRTGSRLATGEPGRRT
jgi:hypothetical protein